MKKMPARFHLERVNMPGAEVFELIERRTGYVFAEIYDEEVADKILELLNSSVTKTASI